MAGPQAFTSSYAPRLRNCANSLLAPAIQPTTTQVLPSSRTTKRGTLAINYAEDGFDDDEFGDGEGSRRPTGLRSLRRDDTNQEKTVTEKTGVELSAPVEMQGNWREWMAKPHMARPDIHLFAQTALPLTLIPIRIDLDIPPYTPDPPYPLPHNSQELGINPNLPAYRRPETTPAFRLRDVFLWNLHETMMTPDQFGLIMANDLDLPNKPILAQQISNQIRQQLEEYAGVALHPLFHSSTSGTTNGAGGKIVRAFSRDASTTPAVTNAPTPLANGAALTNGHASPSKLANSITASAEPLPAPAPDARNPDDTYRCIVILNINLQNMLYTDKFEWSLLHPPGFAETFAKQTCADMGLTGEWVSAIAHGICEAVLRLKKEACESGGLVGGNGYGGEIDNLAAEGREAGWRFDNEQLADEWEPKLETLSKEEIEKREGDRERQIRRLRRETARFSSSTGMMGGMPQNTPGGYLDNPESEAPMGRGERSKKKRRFRSLSPVGRGNTPGGRGTPDVGGVAGYGGGGGLGETERYSWRCSHCLTLGSAVWAVRDGPMGPRSLCNNCGLVYERDKRLPPWSKDLHKDDQPLIR
ncbi:MAG: Chromatin structure remodeling complex protein sfh1 [Piccolia ochrophora]|nr:MAG: Chromatin structure remodeling complex protein sfh1 [Piccolia ochrophora]